MKNAYKLMVLLLVAALMMALTACGAPQSTEPTDEVITEEAAEVDVTFDAYMGTLYYDEADESGTITTYETGSLSIIAYPGETVEQALDGTTVTAVREGDVFEGWVEYKDVITMDEDGFEFISYERVGEGVYTTEEVLQRQVPDYSVTYAAKWESMSDESYDNLYAEEFVEEEIAAEYYLSLYSNGGVIYMGGEEPYSDIALGGYSMTEGQLMADVIGEPIQKVEKEGAQFTGWAIYTAPDYAVMMEEPGEPAENELVISMGDYGYLLLIDYQVYSQNASTEELTAIVCEAVHYFAIPNFA